VIVLVALSVLVGALAQSLSGIGFSLVSGPLLVAALGPHDGIRLSVALSLVLNVALLVRLHRGVDVRATLLLLVPSALATPLLAVAARGLPTRPAAALAGAVVLLGTVLLATGARWHAARGPVGAVVTGIVAAATNVVAAVAGPAVALWSANAGWSVAVARPTLQAYFLGLNLVALPSLGLPRTGVALPVTCLVAMAAGLALGGPLSRRTSEETARRGTLLLAGAGGLAVLVRAVVGG
jgi:uncharacterized protein